MKRCRPTRKCLPAPASAQSYSFFFQPEDGIRYPLVTGVQTCALPISCTPWTLFLLLCVIRCAVFSKFHALHGPCFYCFAGSGALFSANFMHSMDPVSIALRDQERCFQQISCTPWILFLLLCGIKIGRVCSRHGVEIPCYYCYARASCDL